jgi:AraC-like DNA-binding protein
MTKPLIQSLADSKIYREYEHAFSTATGLPLALRAVESWQLPHHGQSLENPFCQLLAQTSSSCEACLKVQQQLAATATESPQTITCEAGLCETAVPLRLGDKLVGFLTTGQVFHRRKPTAAQFRRTVKLLADWGVPAKPKEWRDLYFNTRVLSAVEVRSAIQLLKIFAEHLAMMSNQIVTQEQFDELPLIARAKQYIRDHQTERLTLNQVAKAVETSRFNFCKQFTKSTGIHFTAYLTRVRIERAKNLLLNPNLRVSEIAYDSGFQSLTHFNREFKRIQGDSPTDYREKLIRLKKPGVKTA